MVHIENTAVAGGAMVTSLWLEYVAHETVATALMLCITKMEAPRHRDLPRIGGNRLDERPYHHEKDHMEEE